jgi:hypothetical protein
MALDSVQMGAAFVANRVKAASRGIPLAAALQDAAAGAHIFGVRWQAKRDTALMRTKTEPKLKNWLKFRCVRPAYLIDHPDLIR